MNIKSIVPSPVSPIEPKKRIDGNARTQASTDRDADGRQQQAEPEIKRHLSEQELDEAIKAIEASPGLKANNLSVKVVVQDDHRVIYIVDSKGEIVRRLSEAQLWERKPRQRPRHRQNSRQSDVASPLQRAKKSSTDPGLSHFIDSHN